MTQKTCPDCNGEGAIEKDTDDERRCPTCAAAVVSYLMITMTMKK
jgi:DnaJ-class molecular chaperone